MKTLEDICLTFIAGHFSTYQRLENRLSSHHKEILLERMCNHGQLTKSSLPAVSYALFSHTLQRISLCFSSQLDDRCLELLGGSGVLPTSVTIQKCPNITDKGIASLARIVRKAEELFLVGLKQLTGEGIHHLMSRSLKHLSLQECTGITDPGFSALVRNCPNVEKLCLAELDKLSDAAFTCLAEVLAEKLVELDASEVNRLTSSGTTALATHCSNLRVVSFEMDTHLDGAGLVRMAENCPISSLNMSFCYKVPAQEVEVIVSMLRAKGTLQSFEAMGRVLSPIGLELLASTSSLQKLSLCGVALLTDQTVDLLARSMAKTLVNLDVSNCALTDESCASIARHCQAIESLGLRNAREITGAPLIRLFSDGERNKNITAVTFSGSKKVQPEVVEALVSNCCNLEVVTMAGLKGVTDTVALAVARRCPEIQHISFRNCDLTDLGICEMAAGCPQLCLLAVAGVHALTDKSIMALAEHCPHLEELYISGCDKITKQAVTYLKDCVVSGVQVFHTNPSAPIGLLMAKDLDTGEYTRVDNLHFDSVERLSRARKTRGRTAGRKK